MSDYTYQKPRELKNPVEIHCKLISERGNSITVRICNNDSDLIEIPADQYNVIARGQHLADGNKHRWVLLEMEADNAADLLSPGLGALQAEIASWADEIIPDRKVSHAFDKMVEEEIPELLESEFMDPLEFADVAILLLDVAHLAGIDIETAVRDKMKINRDREWAVDKNGRLGHVKK